MPNNRSHKFQQIPIRVVAAGSIVEINTATEKGFTRVKGVELSFPEENGRIGTTIGLVINQLEVFPESYEAKMLTSNNSVSPNSKYFLLPWKVDADGSTVNVRFRDGSVNSYLQAGSPGSASAPTNPLVVNYPYDAILKLWLTNDPL